MFIVISVYCKAALIQLIKTSQLKLNIICIYILSHFEMVLTAEHEIQGGHINLPISAP